MNLRCLLGLHRPINNFSSWDNGYNISACSACGTEMTKSPGMRWQAIRRADR